MKENQVKSEELYNYVYNVEKDPKTKIVTENEEVYQIRRKKQLDFGDNKKENEDK